MLFVGEKTSKILIRLHLILMLFQILVSKFDQVIIILRLPHTRYTCWDCTVSYDLGSCTLVMRMMDVQSWVVTRHACIIFLVWVHVVVVLIADEWFVLWVVMRAHTLLEWSWMGCLLWLRTGWTTTCLKYIYL